LHSAKIGTLAMRTRLRPISRLSLIGWLCLALVLPLAQAAAAWHALSHTAQEVAAAGNAKHAPHSAQCEACLAGAAVGGGPVTADWSSLPLAAVRHAAPLARPIAWRASAAPHAYRSRAPPTASC
jgi:hypothetical protein